MLSLAKSVENAETVDEARVLVVMAHLVPELENWRLGNEFRDELAEAGKKSSALRKAFEENQLSSRNAQREVDEAVRLVGMLRNAALVLGVAFVVAFLFIHIDFLRIVLLFAAGGAGAGWLMRRNGVAELQTKKSTFEATGAKLDTEIKDLEARKEAIDVELTERSGGFPEIQLTHLIFPITPTNLDGRTLLIDNSGAHDIEILKNVDVSQIDNGLDHISSAVSRIIDVPPMLSPDSMESGARSIDTLYGEENVLSELVGDYTANLGKLKSMELSLSVITPDSELARRLRATEYRPTDESPAIMVLDRETISVDLPAFVTAAEKTRTQGQQTLETLGVVFDRLSTACDAYADARMASVNMLHGNLLQVLQRATWCNRRFYCARTIMSPVYVQDLLDVEIDQAYKLPINELIYRLRQDQTIRERMDTKPELVTQLIDSHMSILQFSGANFSASGVVTVDTQESVGRPLNRHAEASFQESLQAFSRTMQKIMTGAAFPVLNFSEESKLYYDPDTEEWSSDLTPYVYTSHDVLRYGSVVKAYADLMIPLWEHLWTEKADFRKSETFRTNEQILRLSEKEAEKVIDIANQFRSDMRLIRENTNNLAAESKSKMSEITGFQLRMEGLGLLSDQTRVEIADSGIELDDAEDVITVGDRYEAVLAGLPQTQMESRGTVQDPIDLVKSPDALVGLPVAAPHRIMAA